MALGLRWSDWLLREFGHKAVPGVIVHGGRTEALTSIEAMVDCLIPRMWSLFWYGMGWPTTGDPLAARKELLRPPTIHSASDSQ